MIQLINHEARFHRHISEHLKKQQRTINRLWWALVFVRTGLVVSVCFMLWSIYQAINGISCGWAMSFPMGKLIEFEVDFDCFNPNYKVVVRQYALGQFRLQLLKEFGLGWDIVREACTYQMMTAIAVRDGIASCSVPEEFMETLVRPWNCEGPGGRIRLDNKPEDVRGPWEPWTSNHKQG